MNHFNYPSEKELMIEPQWFTGQQWKDGTAERESKREFLAAVEQYRKRRHSNQRPEVCPDRSRMSLLDLRREMGQLRKKYS